MSKAKSAGLNIFQIIFNGLKIYIRNFIPLFKVMLFPVFGQLIGIILILYPTYLLSQQLPKMMSPEFMANNIILVFLLLLLVAVPGFFIFIKAFWEYMIAMVSLNSMTSNIMKQGHIKDSYIHTQTTKLKTKEYVTLLLILSLIWLIGLLLPAIVFLFRNPFDINQAAVWLGFIGLEVGACFILTIVSVYLSLCFQVIAFENITPIKIIKKSWELVEGNFWRTFFLAIAMSLITGLLVPCIFQMIIDSTPLMAILTHPFQAYAATIMGSSETLSTISQFTSIMGTQLIPNSPDSIIQVGKTFTSATIGIIITSLLLPLGSACYTQLYFDIVNRKNSKSKKK